MVSAWSDRKRKTAISNRASALLVCGKNLLTFFLEIFLERRLPATTRTNVSSLGDKAARTDWSEKCHWITDSVDSGQPIAKAAAWF